MWDSGTVRIDINGESITLPVKQVTANKIRELAAQHGLTKFSVRVDSREVKSPSTFKVRKGSVVEISAHDIFGGL